MGRPVLFCYDGSEGSGAALSVAVELVMHPADAVVLVVWTPVAMQLARGGSLLVAVPNEGQIDAEEIAAAQRLADAGAEALRERGYHASARVTEANGSVANSIGEVAREIDACLIVCGQRGRGAFVSAVLGSVSHQLSARAERPVLIVPQHLAQ
jgi:nucleotide-binding universal stress UspA family protein